MATFPWDAPAEPPVVVPSIPQAGAPYTANPTTAALRAAQQVQQIADANGDLMGASESIRRIMRSGGVDDGHLTTGGLVLPGGGQLAQSDGAVTNDTLKLSPQQIDSIIASNLKQGRIPGEEKLKSGLELELSIPPHILKKLSLQQTDGGVDGDDVINSDLDDSDEDQDDYAEDEDLENGMIMLCLYDKVQRVKNKWKYVLKDGIANINGKDYVFAKATGESEW